MVPTGKAKKDFQEWFRTKYKDRITLDTFYSLDNEFRFGVLQQWFESEGFDVFFLPGDFVKGNPPVTAEVYYAHIIDKENPIEGHDVLTLNSVMMAQNNVIRKAFERYNMKYGEK